MKIVSNEIAPWALSGVAPGTAVRSITYKGLYLVTSAQEVEGVMKRGSIALVDLDDGQLTWMPSDTEVIVEPYAQVVVNPDTPRGGAEA